MLNKLSKKGNQLSRKELQSITAGRGARIGCNTPQDCADEYNQTAFEALPASAFLCRDGVCEFA